MDKAGITVAAAASRLASLSRTSAQVVQQGRGGGLDQQQQQHPVEDLDREIAAKCEQLGQQTNLQLMQNAFQKSEW